VRGRVRFFKSISVKTSGIDDFVKKSLIHVVAKNKVKSPLQGSPIDPEVIAVISRQKAFILIVSALGAAARAHDGILTIKLTFLVPTDSTGQLWKIPL
jgi:hypothetical protein